VDDRVAGEVALGVVVLVVLGRFPAVEAPFGDAEVEG